MSEGPRQRAIGQTSEMMGELVAFWGFKQSTGRVWTHLYLSRLPLPADEIADRTKLSSGAVSMALTELMKWDLVERAHVSGERKRHYTACTDVWGVIRRIFRERELRLVGRAVQRFADSVELLERAQAEDPEDPEIAFVLERLKGLHKLARIGYRLVDRFAAIGEFSLDPIRGALSAVIGKASPDA